MITLSGSMITNRDSMIIHQFFAHKKQLRMICTTASAYYYFLPDPEQQEHVSEPPNRNWK